MSKVIDERVVSMQFDNAKFERNVATTMSTLDKLKQKLNFTGMSKGLENVNTAAKGIDLNPVGRAAETVGLKFNAMYTMADQALRNITNSAMTHGKRIVSALTIDPVKTGFSEYETQINAVQTILANTESKGTTLDQVNNALEELNRYADKTIYNFTEMTRNIGTFTAAGVDLDTSVNAIQGIANLAAVSGSTSQQASTAMYQLSQALSSGTVKLMDWNSVVNAGMGGQVFQDALKETARVHGVAIDSMIEEQGSFRETLSSGWLSAEILTDTLQKFTMTTEGLSEAQIEANRQMLKAKGYTDEQIEGIFKLGNTATNAATKVKTLTQLWDVMKEAAQSGWAQTWKLIVGDFEQAKALFTPLSDFFTGIINKISDARNAVLESSFAKNFRGLGKILKGIYNTVVEPIEAVNEVITGITRTLDEHRAVVDEVIDGKWGHMEKRWTALADAGYDWMWVQNKVNEKLGNSVRRTTTYTGEVEKQTEAEIELGETQAQRIAQLADMSDAELKALNLTDEQIEALRDLKSIAGQLGLTVEDVIENIDDIDGRWILLNSFKNIGKGIVDAFNAIKKAWQEIFPPKSTEEQAAALFNLLGAFHKFTMVFRSLTDEEGNLTETGDQLRRTFRGIFAVIDILSNILGGAFSIAFRVASAVLSYFDLDILSVTASIGDAIVGFRDFLASIFDINVVLDAIVPLVANAANAISTWFNTFKESDGIQDTIKYINELINNVKAWWASLADAEDLPKTIAEGIVHAFESIPVIVSRIFSNIWSAFIGSFGELDSSPIDGIVNSIQYGLDIAGQTIAELGKILIGKLNEFLSAHGFKEISYDAIAGLVEGFKDGAVNAWNAAVGMVTQLVAKVKEFLGIHSPSTVFAAIGGFMIAGLIAGLQNGIPDSLGAVKDVFQPMLDWIKALDFGSIIASVISIGTIATVYKGFTVLDKFASPLESLGDVFESVSELINRSAKSINKVIKGTANVLNGVAWDLKAQALQKIAIAIAILAASILALSLIDDPKKLWNAVGVIAVLVAILAALAFAMSKLGTSALEIDASSKTLSASGIQRSLLEIGAAVLMLAFAVKMIGDLSPEKVKQGFIGLASIAAGMLIFVAAMGGISRFTKDASGIGGMMLKMALTIGIMAIVIKMLGNMDPADTLTGLIVLEAFVLLIMQMGLVSRIAGATSAGLGSNILKISVAMGVLAIVIKMLSGMEAEEVLTGLGAMQALVLVIAELALINKLAKGKANKVGSTVLQLAGTMLILSSVVWMLSLMREEDILKGFVAMQLFGALIAELIWISKLGGKKVADVSKNILAMSVAIAVLAGVAVLLGLVNIENLLKGVTAVGILGLVMAAMVAATKGTKDIKSNLVVMVVAIGLMTAAVIALTYIDGTKLSGAVAALGSLMLCFGLMSLMTSKIKNTKAMRQSLLFMIGIVAVLAGVLAAMSLLPNAQNLVPAASAIGVLLNLLATSILVISKAKSNFKTSFVQLQSMVLVVTEIAALLSAMSFLPNPQNLIPTAAAIGILLNLLATSILVMSKAKGNFKVAFVQLQSMALVIAEVAAILAAMSFLPNPNNMIPSAIAIGILLNLLATSLLIVSYAGPNIQNAIGPMLAMSAVVAVLGLVFAMLTALNAEATIPTATSLGIVLMSMAAACLIASAIPSALAIQGALGLAAFIGIMAAVIAAFGALTLIPGFTNIIEQGSEMFIMVGDAIGGFIGAILGGIGASLISLIPQLGDALNAFSVSVKPFLDTVAACEADTVVKAGFLTAVIKALTVTSFISGIGSLLGIGLPQLGKDLGKFGKSVSEFNKSLDGINAKSVEAAQNTATMLLTLTANDVLTGMTSWLFGGVNYESMSKDLQSFGKAVVNFSNTVSGKVDNDSVEAATKAGELLVAFQTAIPKSGGLIQDIFGEHDFGAFATACGNFADAILDINERISAKDYKIDNDKIEQIADAGHKFSDLAEAIPKTDGLLQDIVGKQDLTTFATAVGNFVDAILTVNKKLSVDGLRIESTKIKAIAEAGDHFSELANDIPKSAGFVQAWVGEKDLSSFGKAVEEFAKCIITVNEALNQDGFTVNLAGMENLKQAGLKFNELQGTLPTTGGWWEGVAGSQDLGDFGESIKTFATAMVEFSNASLNMNATAMDNAISFSYKLRELMLYVSNIDYSGVADFTGVGTGGFGADGPAYDIAQAMSKFSSEVANIDTYRVSVAVDTAIKLKDLISGLATINTSGIEKFKVDAVGVAIKNYANEVGGVDTALVSSSIYNAERLKTLVSSLTDVDPSGIGNFKIESIGTSIKSYGNSVADANFIAMSQSVAVANKLLAFIKSTAGVDASGVDGFVGSLEKLKTIDIDSIANAFSNGSGSMSSAGMKLIDGLIEGMCARMSTAMAVISKVIDTMLTSLRNGMSGFIKSGGEIADSLNKGITANTVKMATTMNTTLTAMVNGVKLYYSSFYSAGSHLVTGFSNGISDNAYKAAAKARAMAKSAADEARKVLDINSPSRVFKTIGAGIPEGFAIGIEELSGTVDKSVGNMASNAIDSARSSMDSILTALSSDMDAQPTIRPVLDLSDVKTGASAIGSIFGGTQTVGVQSNIGAVSLAMNRKVQNGGNDAIVASINKLRGDIATMPRNTYSINGITYDDGSNIHSAIEEIARYALRERRM